MEPRFYKIDAENKTILVSDEPADGIFDDLNTGSRCETWHELRSFVAQAYANGAYSEHARDRLLESVDDAEDDYLTRWIYDSSAGRAFAVRSVLG